MMFDFGSNTPSGYGLYSTKKKVGNAVNLKKGINSMPEIADDIIIEYKDMDDIKDDSQDSSENISQELVAESFKGTVGYSPLSEEELEDINVSDRTYFKTKDVAAFLGITDQLVRNYCAAFDQFLDIEKTPTGQRRFQRKDIEKLGSILQIMEEKKLTVNETIDFLQGNDKKKEFYLAPHEQKIELLLQLVSDEVKKAVEDITKQNHINMLEQSEKNSAHYKELQNCINDQSESIEELRKEIEKRDQIIENLLKNQEQVIIRNNQQTKEDIMAAVSKKKKIWPFG